MSDPAAASQLLKGFYNLEDNAWRWTAGEFQVVLNAPPGAAQNGAMLTLSLSVPDVVVKKLGAVTLSAAIGKTRLAPQKYSTAGAFTYAAEVPASAFTSATATIDFILDKKIPASAADNRELGIIATAVGLEPR